MVWKSIKYPLWYIDTCDQSSSTLYEKQKVNNMFVHKKIKTEEEKI